MSKKIACIASFCWVLCCPARPTLEDYFQLEAELSHFNGVVWVAEGDSLLFQKAHESLDVGQEDLLHLPYDIGSISKQFTAAAILLLVQEGKVSLDDPINQHLGPYSSDRWKKISVHHLLSHSSGIPSLYQTDQGLELFFPKEELIDRQSLIDRFSDAKPLFKAGKKFSYSNSGYILLAAIIEQLSGMEYGVFMRKRIFEPMGLRHTCFGQPAEAAQPYYNYLPKDLKQAPVYHPSWFVGAGGIYSTAEDMSRWVQVLGGDGLLSSELRDLLFQRHLDAGSGFYGYGWQVKPEGFVEHDGGNAGFMSFLRFDPSNGRHIIILTNRSFEDIKMFGKSSEKVREWVDHTWQALEGKELPLIGSIEQREVSPSNHELDNGSLFQIVNEEGKAYASIEGLQASRVMTTRPLSEEEDAPLPAIAGLLESGRYRKLAKHCDGEMKFVVRSGLMRIGMKMMTKRVGEMQSFIPYIMGTNWGLIRMSGSEAVMDLIVYFDKQGRMSGIFEHGLYPLNKSLPMRLYPLADGSLFLDGFPYGEPSLKLRAIENGLEVMQEGRKMVLSRN